MHFSCDSYLALKYSSGISRANGSFESVVNAGCVFFFISQICGLHLVPMKSSCRG